MSSGIRDGRCSSIDRNRIGSRGLYPLARCNARRDPAEDRPMSIEIIPTGAALGAEIRGIDLAQPLDDATFAAVDRAYNEHGVIFFRDQQLTPPQQVAFTRRFGEIEFNIFGERWSAPASPEIVVLSTATENARPIGVPRAGETCPTTMGSTPRPPPEPS